MIRDAISDLCALAVRCRAVDRSPCADGRTR